MTPHLPEDIIHTICDQFHVSLELGCDYDENRTNLATLASIALVNRLYHGCARTHLYRNVNFNGPRMDDRRRRFIKSIMINRENGLSVRRLTLGSWRVDYDLLDIAGSNPSDIPAMPSEYCAVLQGTSLSNDFRMQLAVGFWIPGAGSHNEDACIALALCLLENLTVLEFDVPDSPSKSLVFRLFEDVSTPFEARSKSKPLQRLTTTTVWGTEWLPFPKISVVHHLMALQSLQSLRAKLLFCLEDSISVKEKFRIKRLYLDSVHINGRGLSSLLSAMPLLTTLSIKWTDDLLGSDNNSRESFGEALLKVSSTLQDLCLKPQGNENNGECAQCIRVLKDMTCLRNLEIPYRIIAGRDRSWGQANSYQPLAFNLGDLLPTSLRTLEIVDDTWATLLDIFGSDEEPGILDQELMAVMGDERLADLSKITVVRDLPFSGDALVVGWVVSSDNTARGCPSASFSGGESTAFVLKRS